MPSWARCYRVFPPRSIGSAEFKKTRTRLKRGPIEIAYRWSFTNVPPADRKLPSIIVDAVRTVLRYVRTQDRVYTGWSVDVSYAHNAAGNKYQLPGHEHLARFDWSHGCLGVPAIYDRKRLLEPLTRLDLCWIRYHWLQMGMEDLVLIGSFGIVLYLCTESKQLLIF